ncbi:hypothetical protein ACIRVK_22360 [Streptomyces sp. NPDC101152]|uniref:hypothetical protein n=1 Tax=Streptomyces sp. NPDC101152 TaxID=3366116 RepID=UPI00381A57CF
MHAGTKKFACVRVARPCRSAPRSAYDYHAWSWTDPEPHLLAPTAELARLAAELEALDRLEREPPQPVEPLVYRDLCRLRYAEAAERAGS